MNAFTIRDIENLSGVKAHTIRIWEQRYHFLKPQRTDTNIRYYSNEELKMVLNIALLNKCGFKISHIDRMSDAEIQEKVLALNHQAARQEWVINELVKYMIDLDMEAFEDLLNEHIRDKGIEKTIIHYIFPFLEKIGILWQTGHIHPAQEHLVTNIIRQKLIAGIEATASHARVPKTYLLFLPEDEHHELGLLFMYFLLKSRGANVIYLGANVPIKDAATVIDVKKPDALYIHLTATSTRFNFEKFLLTVEQKFGKIPTLISGEITRQYRKRVPEHVHFKTSLSMVMDFISSIGS